jgi:hypothetical protein
MPLLFIPIALIVIAAGRSLSHALRLPAVATTLERNLAGYAIGLALLSYCMLGIGLAGLLYPAAGWGLLAALALIGLPQIVPMAREARSALLSCFHPQGAAWLMMAVLVLFGALVLVGVCTPPVTFLSAHGPFPVDAAKAAGYAGIGYTEWDSIAYHLADPKLYLQHHRIYYIPWEHHSNFAFTAEMWYLWAMLAAHGSIALAKMFHWSCWLAASLAVYAIGSRHFSVRAGALGAILFASTPLAFWEAGTAYVDLSTAFFLTATLLGVVSAVKTKEAGWWNVSAVLMGITLSTKATAGISLILIAIGLLWWKLKNAPTPGRAVGSVAGWCAVALAVGCPWYVKSWAYTGNPVYPFAYSVFGGRNWNQEAANAYDGSNKSFGLGHQPINVLLAPWNLTMYVMPGHPAEYTGPDGKPVMLYPFLDPGNTGSKPFNDFATELATLSPVLLAALFAPLVIRRQRKLAAALGLYAGAAFLMTFLAMQYVRYLLPLVPLLCLLAAYTIDELLTQRRITGWALSLLTLASVAYSAAFAGELAANQFPVASGKQPQADYVSHAFPAYDAIDYLNRQTPSGTKTVFYGNPLGFYSDKPYFWGEKNHSGYVPYDGMHSSGDLLAFFHRTGVTHVLVDTRGFGLAPSPGWTGWVYDLTAGRSQPVFEAHGAHPRPLPCWKGSRNGLAKPGKLTGPFRVRCVC